MAIVKCYQPFPSNRQEQDVDEEDSEATVSYHLP